jgi:hypothetical protein
MKVGITGHQNLGSDDTIMWLRERISAVLDENPVTEGFTCLAKGADQVYAEILLGKFIPYTFVRPCQGYEGTFRLPSDLVNFERLRKDAAHTIEMPFQDPSESAYLRAGQFIVDNSELLIAVWDGLPAKGMGGTGDIVSYALSKKKAAMHINPITQMTKKLGHAD